MFAVFRNASEIGRHSVSIQRSGDDATAAIDAAFTVKIGPVPVFRYHHEAVEVWRDGRFISLKSTSISNGAREQVSAMRTGSGVTIDCAKGRIVAGDAAPLTHWNSHALRRTLFNPQTGALLRDTVTGPDRSSVKLYDGRIAPVTRYILTGGRRHHRLLRRGRGLGRPAGPGARQVDDRISADGLESGLDHAHADRIGGGGRAAAEL